MVVEIGAVDCVGVATTGTEEQLIVWIFALVSGPTEPPAAAEVRLAGAALPPLRLRRRQLLRPAPLVNGLG